MTNQEAIKMLTAKVECIRREASGTDIDCNLRNCDDCELCYAQGTTGEQRKALNMAISALQAQEEKHSTEGSEELKQEVKNSKESSLTQKELDKDNGDLQPTCNQLATDTISRQDAIDEIRKCRFVVDAIEKIIGLPSAQPEPCEDAVSRAEAIKCITYDEEYMEECLRQLPSVSPKPRTGKWRKISPAGIYECSECGKSVMTKDIEQYDFCHGCGAKMNGGNQDDQGK